MKRSAHIFWSALTLAVSVAVADPLPVADLQREQTVDFASEIYPILKQNCLACHHTGKTEGGLTLETHETLLTGGDSGGGVVAQDLENSLIFQRASGALDDIMPPEDNNVGAKSLTADQLGLIKLWINQGAPGGEVAVVQPVTWQPVPDSIRAPCDCSSNEAPGAPQSKRRD